MSEVEVKTPKTTPRSVFASEQSRSEEDNDISMNSDVASKDVQLPPPNLATPPEGIHRCTHCSHVCEHRCSKPCESEQASFTANNCHQNHSNEWIKLNVGGTLFQTTRTTLCSDHNSFFYRLCQDDSSLNSKKVSPTLFYLKV